MATYEAEAAFDSRMWQKWHLCYRAPPTLRQNPIPASCLSLSLSLSLSHTHTHTHTYTHTHILHLQSKFSLKRRQGRPPTCSLLRYSKETINQVSWFPHLPLPHHALTYNRSQLHGFDISIPTHDVSSMPSERESALGETKNQKKTKVGKKAVL